MREQDFISTCFLFEASGACSSANGGSKDAGGRSLELILSPPVERVFRFRSNFISETLHLAQEST